ncbi:MAG: hypothetical protein DWQ04_15940 [Chloroflexi bacterium]|nr:MAG: hypothetical protein DWQ04_15940 [Chloroflexota bacterium]
MKRFSWMQLVRDFCDGFFEMLGEILLAFIRRVAPFAVPLAPASFFGHAIFAAVALMTSSDTLALVIGGVAALGLESAGILAAHTAIRFYTNGERQKAIIATIITIIYLVIGIVSIWFFEGTGQDAQVAGTAMFLIAGAVYVLIALVDDAAAKQEEADTEAMRLTIEQEAEREQADAEDQRQHEKDLEQMRMDHEAQMAREERQSQERMERYRLKRSGAASNGRSGKGGNGRLPSRSKPVQRISKQQAINALVTFFSEHPTASYRQAGAEIGRSVGWISEQISELEQKGIVQRNGNGVQVVNGSNEHGVGVQNERE